jgi:ATP sulfurylase
VFPCATPAQVRAELPPDADVVAFQCRNPVHRAHYELFTRALHAPNVRPGAVCLVHPTCGPTQVRACMHACVRVCVCTQRRTPGCGRERCS